MLCRFSVVAMLFIAASTASAQSAPSRGWLDVDFVSVRGSQGEQTFTARTSVFQEQASFASAYPELPSATGGNIAGGFNIHPRIGVGVHFVNISYEMPVGLAVNIPHPLFFNRFATDSDVTDSALERKDRSIDIAAVYTVPTPDAVRIRVFGGPTHFNVKQEMVSDVYFNQMFNLLGANVVDITRFDQQRVDGSAWGFNVGTDVAYFFSRYIGVGGVLRFNRGTVEIEKEPLTETPTELKAGHTMIGGGLRLRF
jgi:outer membrane protein with beta-barrel domain